MSLLRIPSCLFAESPTITVDVDGPRARKQRLIKLEQFKVDQRESTMQHIVYLVVGIPSRQVISRPRATSRSKTMEHVWYVVLRGYSAMVALSVPCQKSIATINGVVITARINWMASLCSGQ